MRSQQPEGSPMKPIFAALLVTLTLCACKGRDVPRPVLVADPALIPDLAPVPVDTTRPLPSPMLPDLDCLRQTGKVNPPPNSLSCRGAGSSSGPKNTMRF